MGQINQRIQKIDELLQDGMYETAEKIVTQLNSELSNNDENLYLMQLDDLHSLKAKIDSLSKLAEGLYVKEVAKVRTKRLARMLYACKDLTE
jgi:bisphosphoglycerate-independent phosphoglycerate mutase (AlkP superfamily)